MPIQSLGQEDALEEDMATHSSILTWKIPWTEERGGLQPVGSQIAEHNWSNLAHTQGEFQIPGRKIDTQSPDIKKKKGLIMSLNFILEEMKNHQNKQKDVSNSRHHQVYLPIITLALPTNNVS